MRHRSSWAHRSTLVLSGAALAALVLAAAPGAALAWPTGYPGAHVPEGVNSEPTLVNDEWELLKFDRNNGKDVASNNQFPGFAIDTDNDTFIGSYPCRHVQKTLRLPQRPGYGDRTYFVGTASENEGGWIYLIESYPGVFGQDGEATVADTSKLVGGYAGKVVWFKRTDNATFAGWGGGCNHPGNMTVHPNGTLAVACQNWDKDSDTCEVKQVKANGVPVHDTAVFFSVVNAHTTPRLEYLGHWDIPTELGVGDFKLKTVGLARSGDYTHVWIAGNDYLKQYRAPADFTPVSSPGFNPATDLVPLATDGSGGALTSGTVDVVRTGSGAGALTLVDVETLQSSHTACVGVEVFGECIGKRVASYVESRLVMQRLEYLDAAGNASTTMSASAVKVRAQTKVPTNFIRGNNQEFGLCDPLNYDCPSRFTWCNATAGYHVSPDGLGALYCFDEEVHQGVEGMGLRMRSYAYDTRIVVDTGGGDTHGTDSPIEAKLDFAADSFDWFRLDTGDIDDFERGSHRAYVVPGLPLSGLSALTGVKLRNRGGDRFRPAAVKVERNGSTLLSWTNQSPPIDLDDGCDATLQDGCAASFTIPVSGPAQPLTDLVGVKVETLDTADSGTDSHVYLSFKTETTGWSAWHLLDNEEDNLNRGKTDYFVIDVGQPVSGAIEAVKIKNTGDDLWRPKSISIDPTVYPGQPINTWSYELSWTETNGSVNAASDCDNVLGSGYNGYPSDTCSPTFVLLPNNTHHLSDWEIWFHTRNSTNAGTDEVAKFQVDFDTGRFSAVGYIDDAADNVERNRWDAMPITGLTEAEDTGRPLKVWLENPGSDGWQPDEVVIKHLGTTVWHWTRPSSYGNVWVDSDAATPTSPTDGAAKSLVLIDNGGSNPDAIDDVISLQHDTWVRLQTATDPNAGTNTEIVLSAQFESGMVLSPLLIVDETPANLEIGTTQKLTNLVLPTDQGKITKLMAVAKGTDGWAPQSIEVYSRSTGYLFSWTRSQAVWLDSDGTTPETFLDDRNASAGVFLNAALGPSPSGYLAEASSFGYDEYTIDVHTSAGTDSQTDSTMYFTVQFASGNTAEHRITSSLDGVLEQDATDSFGVHHVPMSNAPGPVTKVKLRAGGTDGWSPDSVVIRHRGTVVWEWTRPALYSDLSVDLDAPTPASATDDGKASTIVLIDNGGSNVDSIANASSW